MRYIVLVTTVIGILAVGSTAAREKKPKAAETASAQTTASAHEGLSMDEMFAQYAAMMTPGDHHRALDYFVGSWDIHTKMMMPGMESSESPGSAEYGWIYDGHYLEARYTAVMMGMPFSGRMTLGYDNYRKQYVASWIDNMTTGIATLSGWMDPTTKTCTLLGVMDEPMTGEIGKYQKWVTRVVDDDHFVFEIHDLVLGEHSKVMEMTYTRRK